MAIGQESEWVKAVEVKGRFDISLSLAYKLMRELGAVSVLNCLRLERKVFNAYADNLKREGDSKRAIQLTLVTNGEPAAPAAPASSPARTSPSGALGRPAANAAPSPVRTNASPPASPARAGALAAGPSGAGSGQR